MQLHTRFDQRAVVHTAELPWVDSPLPGVQRRLIERDGEEQARATSLVRYAPGSQFAPHAHPLGEEILVLEGEFTDDSGHHPAGSYLRNPPGSSHAPSSGPGCLLFVKLRHFQPGDQQAVRIDTRQTAWRQGLVPGLSVMPLAEFAGNGRAEHTALVRWAPDTFFSSHRHWGGEEIFVIDGVFEDQHGRYPAGTWLRSPHLSEHQPFSREGCTILVKTGHLPATQP
jgi:anti-sigma factor ChrR (cupin superfamily)